MPAEFEMMGYLGKRNRMQQLKRDESRLMCCLVACMWACVCTYTHVIHIHVCVFYFVHTHVEITWTRALRGGCCWFITWPTDNGKEGFEMGSVYCFFVEYFLKERGRCGEPERCLYVYLKRRGNNVQAAVFIGGKQ